MSKEYAWHFLALNNAGKPMLRDGSALPRRGRWLRFEGELVLCERGLHASSRIIDALRYAPGPYITRVEVAGGVRGNDKLVCSSRKVVWGFDATELLQKFARQQALGCLDKWVQPVPDVVRLWIETGDKSLRSAAESAARSAAESAARSAAESAARSAAESAARSAADSSLSTALFAEATSLGLKGGFP